MEVTLILHVRVLLKVWVLGSEEGSDIKENETIISIN